MIGLMLGVAFALLAGCADGFKRFKALPATDRGYFDGCTHVKNVQVKAASDCKRFPLLDDRYQKCWGKVRGQYADLPGLEARKRWLISQGCSL